MSRSSNQMISSETFFRIRKLEAEIETLRNRPVVARSENSGVHSMDGQSVAVLAIVAVAAAILLRRVFSLKRHASGCGTGCSGCSKSGRPQAAMPLVQLGTPSFSSTSDAKSTSASTPTSASE
ncbi:MAG: FeoB-associated Cys-rich membrane protein [Planctomycetaceae bacterium]|nr:FeoB-associated Cys-rich membrane protein [Planctomycetaceae bacterium]